MQYNCPNDIKQNNQCIIKPLLGIKTKVNLNILLKNFIILFS